MAIFYPEFIDLIKNRDKYNTEEYKLFLELYKLDDTYEVFIEPYVNGDSIDIIVLKKGFGAHIIQVYGYEDYNNLKIKPFDFYNVVKQRIYNYKNNLYNLHIESLKNKNLFDRRAYGCVKSTIYINDEKLFNVLSKHHKDKNINILGNDNEIKDHIEKNFYNNNLFDDDIYLEMKNLFLGKFKINNKLEKIEWTQKQKELIKSEDKHSKICGVAGSGKTLVLAKRAVNAAIRTNSRVLVLTYNITLRKYIEDKIGAFSGGLSKNNFKIIHFHEFINQELNNNHIKDEKGNIYNATIAELDGDLCYLKKALDEHKENIKKYRVILIDEVQDFKHEWLDVIKKYFLDNSNGEYVLFGDEKQNLYNRSLDENKKSKTNIRGAWNRLSKSFRTYGEIQQLCARFQDWFFYNKYELDYSIDKKVSNQIDQTKDNIRYLYRPEWSYNDIFKYLIGYINDKSINLNDVCVLSSSIEELRNLEYNMRTIHMDHMEYAERVVETKEEYDEICRLEKSWGSIEWKLRGIRRIRRFNFQIDSGKIKLCTVQSFKGWETNTLFIILEDNKDSKSKDEILYTALTRCKENLVIINRSSIEYDQFFRAVLKEEQLKFDHKNYCIEPF